MRILIILLLSSLITFSTCNVQNSSIASFGKQVAELDTSIWYILQDKSNNFWFGSRGKGIYYYDGETLRNITTEDGLLGNDIRGIQEDRMGNIFIVSLGGINKFNGKEFIKLNAVMGSEWELNPDDLWFNILGRKDEKGVYRYDGNRLYFLELPKNYLEEEHFRKYPNATFNPYEVYSIYKDQKGNMWFGTANLGVCRYDGNALSWLYEDHLTNTPNGASFGIRSIFEDHEGMFWFCNTLNRYDIAHTFTIKKGMNLIDYKSKNGTGKLISNLEEDYFYFFSITQDFEGDLWMVTYDQGVLQFHENELSQHQIIENDDTINIFTIYKDKQNTLWLGTHNAGAYKYNGSIFEKFKP